MYQPSDNFRWPGSKLGGPDFKISQIASVINILVYLYSLLKWVLELRWNAKTKTGWPGDKPGGHGANCPVLTVCLALQHWI